MASEAHGLFINNIPAHTSKEDIVASLRRVVGGAYGMKYVLYPCRGADTKAYVQFSAFPEKLYAGDFRIHGEPVRLVPAQFEVYSVCTAHVDALVVASVHDVEHCIEHLKVDFGLLAEYSDDTGQLLLTGSFIQLESAQTWLQEVFNRQRERQQAELLMTARNASKGLNASRHVPAGVDDRLASSGLMDDDRYREPPLGTGATRHECQHHHHHCHHQHEDDTFGSGYGGSGWSRDHVHGHNHYHCGQRVVSLPPSSSARTAGWDASGDWTSAQRGGYRHSDDYDDWNGRRGGRSIETGGIGHDHLADQMQKASIRERFDERAGKLAQHDQPSKSVPGAKAFDDSSVHNWRYPAAGVLGSADVGTRDPLRGRATDRSEMPYYDDSDEEIDATAVEPRTTADLDYYIVKYLLKCQRASVSNIELLYNVKIRSVKKLTDETLQISFVSDEDRADQEDKAREEFVELMMSVYATIIKKDVPIGNSTAEGSMTQQEAKIYRAYLQKVCRRVYVEVDVNTLMLTLVGPFEQVTYGETLIGRMAEEKALSADRPPPPPPPAAATDHDAAKLDPFSSPSEQRRAAATNDPPRDEFRFTASGDRGQSLEVRVYTSDITYLAVDVIVNAANAQLAHYAGVAGDIERAGGDLLRDDCRRIIERDGPLKTTEVVHTASHGSLRCRNVIHTVGPMWSMYTNKTHCADLLQRTFENVLDYSNRVLRAKTVAIPPIGTGIFDVPMDVCSGSLFNAINALVNQVSDLSLRQVHIVSRDKQATQFMQAVFMQLLDAQDQAISRTDARPALNARASDVSFTPRDDAKNGDIGGRGPLKDVDIARSDQQSNVRLETDEDEDGSANGDESNRDDDGDDCDDVIVKRNDTENDVIDRHDERVEPASDDRDELKGSVTDIGATNEDE